MRFYNIWLALWILFLMNINSCSERERVRIKASENGLNIERLERRIIELERKTK